jgi:DNA-binding MarR family transcriptional regulator
MRKNESVGRLLGCLHRHGRMHLHRAFSQWKLGSGSHHFLLILAQRDGLTQAELTEELHIDKANTARTMQKLLDSGYVRKQPDPDDRRAVRIYLTEKGKRLIPKIISIITNWTNTLTAGLSPKEKEAALRLLRKMVDNAVEGVRDKAINQHH